MVAVKIPFVDKEVEMDARHGLAVIVGLVGKYMCLGYVVRITGMGDPMFLPLCGLILLIIYNVVRHIMEIIRNETKSDFFKATVQTEYTAKHPETAIVAYNTLKANLMDKVENILNVKELQADWVKHLTEKELSVLKQSLRKRMFRNIDCLATVEREKPGKYKLWKHKLVSEEVWESLQKVEGHLTKEIDECMLEADELQLGWGQSLFQEVLDVWRHETQIEMQKEHERQKLEEAKQSMEEEKAIAQKKLQINAKEEKQKLIDAERAAAELAREEQIAQEREAKKAKKKSSQKGKNK